MYGYVETEDLVWMRFGLLKQSSTVSGRPLQSLRSA